MSYTQGFWQPLPENFYLKRIRKKVWGVYRAGTAYRMATFIGGYPSAKEQFAVWKVTRRLLK